MLQKRSRVHTNTCDDKKFLSNSYKKKRMHSKEKNMYSNH